MTIERLARLFTRRPVLVVTGAGCSAPSGIPTYRDSEARWQRNDPIQHRDFVSREESRKRYWARSFAGWPAVRDARPNPAHHHLATLERCGFVSTLITQNVDGLHQRAGHNRVIDLHGRLSEVICLDCGDISPREWMQQRLQVENPGIEPDAKELAPDGDADVAGDIVNSIRVPACEKCSGTLKPNVVFYGGAVDRRLVEALYRDVEQASAVMVVGSSLMVFSAFRFCRHAERLGKPVAIVNRGTTRADDIAEIKIDRDCEGTLSELTRILTLE